MWGYKVLILHKKIEVIINTYLFAKLRFYEKICGKNATFMLYLYKELMIRTNTFIVYLTYILI